MQAIPLFPFLPQYKHIFPNEALEGVYTMRLLTPLVMQEVWIIGPSMLRLPERIVESPEFWYFLKWAQ